MQVTLDYPGLLTDGTEFVVNLATTDPVEFTRLVPGCIQSPVTTDLIVRIQNEPGANPVEFIQALVPAGETRGVTVTGSVTAVSGQLYVRIVQGSNASWLSSLATDDTEAEQTTVKIPLRYPGILTDGLEFEVALPFLGSVTLTRVAPGVLTAPDAADLVFRVQDEAGASPTQFIEARIGQGQSVGPIVAGSVLATSSVWVRVIQGGNAQWLYSSASNEGPLVTVQNTLCSLTDVKLHLGKDSTKDDTLLQIILEGVSENIVCQTGFDWETTASMERYWTAGLSKELRLANRPVSAVNEVRVLDSVMDPGLYTLEAQAGILRSRYGVWSGEVEVSYTAGFAQPPRELRHACMIQTAYAWSLSQPGGGRLGDSSPTLPTGGGGYVTQDWHPQVLPVIERWRNWAM